MSSLARQDRSAPAEAPGQAPPSLPALDGLGLDPSYFERSLLGDARAFLARPGKAFRARVIEACHALAGGHDVSAVQPCVEAVELLHAGSLIVDDIEDEAEVRRGLPALHRTIGVPRALNTGNWLYFVALTKLHALALPSDLAIEVLQAAHVCLARCHEGQALDLGTSIADVKKSEVLALAHTTSRLKTGALFGFACALGGYAAEASPSQRAALAAFGERVGVALQLLDDVGSVVAPERHEKAREDLRARRVSWAWALASEVLDDLSFMKLVRSAARPEEESAVIARLAEVVGEAGRARVRRGVASALDALSADFPPGLVRDQLGAELVRLEKSYG
jgi:geranylgeranyl pyrophosphate synthase